MTDRDFPLPIPLLPESIRLPARQLREVVKGLAVVGRSERSETDYMRISRDKLLVKGRRRQEGKEGSGAYREPWEEWPS
jgi:hypothetical protein